ncbi:MAG: cytidylate kinase-like family protein [Bacteroidales bacterium]|nr:cytidylate kinase-like family protein [Bacteroidales bacterium]
MNTKEKFVITISREVGSGGRTVGRKLAERLGVRFCDKQLIKKLTEMFGLSASEIESIKGRKKMWLEDLFSRITPEFGSEMFIPKGSEYTPEVTSEEIFNYESQILQSLADESSCVIAGRSGFFVLKDHPNKLDVFIHASKPNRVERIMRKQELSEKEAEDVIARVDKARENYIQKYASTSRYDLRNYDIVLNMDYLTEDEAVEVILKAIAQD